MAFRFRKSIKIAPGVRLNLGKRSASVSVGGKGLRYTAGTKGDHITAGIPGSGLSYTKKVQSRSASIGSVLILIAVVCVFFLLVGLLSGH